MLQMEIKANSMNNSMSAMHYSTKTKILYRISDMKKEKVEIYYTSICTAKKGK